MKNMNTQFQALHQDIFLFYKFNDKLRQVLSTYHGSRQIYCITRQFAMQYSDNRLSFL